MDCDLPFFEDGECLDAHELEVECVHLLNKVDFSHEGVLNEHEAIESTTKAHAQQASPIDYEATQPMFAWLPVDIIRNTTDNAD